MSKGAVGRGGDLAFLLYVAPFAVNLVYTLYEWAQAGLSANLPQYVFLEVAQNQYVFLVGFAAVLGAALMDFNSESLESRRGGVVTLSRRLQTLAGVSLVLAFIAALYSAGGDPSTAVFNLLDGRYPLVFPALLVLLSFLILPSVKLQGANRDNLLIIVLLIASPAALYEVGKRNTIAGLGLGLILLLAAAFIMLRDSKD